MPCDIPENARIITLETPPRVDVFEDCLFIPMNYNYQEDPYAWGVFGRDRRMLPGSGYARGPTPSLVLQRDTTALDATEVADWADHSCYVYGGMVQAHYGHFLIGAFARFWNWHRLAGQDLRILCHAYCTVEALFSYPYIAVLFGSIGLTPAHFVVPTTPLRVRRIILPHPSFEELHLVHRAFADLCHRIGKHLAPEMERPADDAPIYLTKQNLTDGLNTVVNEADVTEVLDRHGVRVIAPETLGLAAQIALFAEDRLVMGFAGSAFHTSVFRPGRRLLIMDYARHMRANFALIDAVNDNRTIYRHLGTGLERIESNSAFVNRVQLAAPQRVAEELLRVIDTDRPHKQPLVLARRGVPALAG
jgi:capsular polysaccharide biosynthesis protein